MLLFDFGLPVKLATGLRLTSPVGRVIGISATGLYSAVFAVSQGDAARNPGRRGNNEYSTVSHHRCHGIARRRLRHGDQGYQGGRRDQAGADLTGYKTYAWIGSAQIINDPRGQWEPPQLDADAEIRWLIDRELRKRDIQEKPTVETAKKRLDYAVTKMFQMISQDQSKTKMGYY